MAIFKKGGKAECGNYRGISLLSTIGKVLARVLENRLLPLSDEILPESQCGFRLSRGRADMIFTARQLQENAVNKGSLCTYGFYRPDKGF